MVLRERADQLLSLREWLGAVDSGGGRMVFIAGEAGVGKSALIREFCAEHSGIRTAVGMCDASLTPRLLGPVLDIAATWSTPLQERIAAGAEPFDLSAAFMAELANPAIVLVEDAHWADEATLDLLRHVGRRIQRTRALMIVTYRDDETDAVHPLRRVLGDLATAAGIERMRLPRLTLEAVADMADGHDVDTELLYRRTGGNPFFVSEVLASQTIGVPETVRDAVLARAGRLDVDARTVLEAASVVPTRVDVSFLTALSNTDNAAVDACVTAGMLIEDGPGRVAYRHQLARQAVEEALPPGRRVALHGDAVRLLVAAGDPDPATVAHHAAAAGDAAAATRYAAIAARRAAAMGAHREAVALYATALEFSQTHDDAQRADLLDGIAEECRFTGAIERGLQAAQEAVALRRRADDPPALARSLHLLAAVQCDLVSHSAAEASEHEAVAILEPRGESALLAEVCAGLASLHMVASRHDLTLQWADRAIAMAEATGAESALSRALNARGAIRTMTGDRGGRDDLHRCIEVAQRAHLPKAVALGWTNLGGCAADMREYEAAEHALREALAAAVANDDDTSATCSETSLAVVQFERGDWMAAESAFERLKSEPAWTRLSQLAASIVLGKMDARRGNARAAWRLDGALQAARDTEEFQYEWIAVSARAELAWLTDDLPMIPPMVGPLFEQALAVRSDWAVGELGLWLHRAGLDPELPDWCAEPYALQIRGQVRDAAEAWRRIGCPYETASALADSTDASDLLEALDGFDALGAAAAAGRVRRKLHGMGVRRVPRGPRPSTTAHPARLTGREHEVLALAAEGLSDADIAARLYISPKTVGHHVSAVLRKLGAESRAEAAAVARRRGLLAQDREPAEPT